MIDLSTRREFLRSTQNADGGWGFFPGKQSWLEPTAYALMALHADGASLQSFERGWNLMRSWQLPDGSWPPCGSVREPHWTTSLAINLHCLRGVRDQSLDRGVAWLLDSTGVENKLKFRFVHFLIPSTVELDPSFQAWPWRPGNSSWIEPTAHALVALRKAGGSKPSEKLRDRVGMGEKMILERRCHDGGWNYGNRKILGTELPSYAETTALALVGLAGNPSLDVAAPLEVARRYWRETRSSLAKAWLAVCLRAHSVPVDPPSKPLDPNDIMISSLEILAVTGVLA